MTTMMAAQLEIGWRLLAALVFLAFVFAAATYSGGDR